MKWWPLILVAFLVSCGAPATEQEAPAEKAPAAQSTDEREQFTPAEDVPTGNLSVTRQEYTECLPGYEVETAPYLRYATFEKGTLTLEVGFWSNCCGKRTVVANNMDEDLKLDLYQIEDACRCRCCYSAVVSIEGLDADPANIYFGDSVIKRSKTEQ